MSHPARTAIWALVAVLVFLAFGSRLASAQTVKREPARPIPSVEGKDLYTAYCAVCHGKDGKGHGPAAPALKMPTPDLTTIAKRTGGRFSATDVEAVILGKGKPMAAHGTEDMPVWGPVFHALTPDEGGQRLRIANLVQYIESIQVK